MEQSKYERLWETEAYRQVAPGEQHADRFIDIARPQPYHVVADFGCGTGRGAARIRNLTGATVRALDFTENCLDDEVKAQVGEGFSFARHDLTQPLEWVADYGYCTDVLEHIPPQDVDRVLVNIGAACKQLYLAVSLVDDVMGALIGEPLHLTVKPAIWWHSRLKKLGFRIDRSEDLGQVAVFYCSLYASAEDISERAVLNMEEEAALENIRANLSLNLQEIVPYQAQDTTIYLLAGGPSLNDCEAEIVEAGKAGLPIVTVNGTYNWLLDRGIKPAAQVMVDGRAFNKRFVEPVIDSCKYLISSQCDHELVTSLPPEQTWLWHSAHSDLVAEAMTDREWCPVAGGTTVVTRALVLLAMLGFRKVEVFGWDSCLRGDSHHAYGQPENDGERVLTVKLEDKEFRCTGWMVVQAEDCQKVIRHVLGLIPDFQLVVHGDGLIAHILNMAAAKGATHGSK